VAVTTSFVIAAVFESNLEKIYLAVILRFFKRCDRSRSPARIPLDPLKNNVVVVGLGALGRHVHEAMMERHGIEPLFVEFDEDKFIERRDEGFNVVHGDAADPELWTRFGENAAGVFLVLCTLSHTQETRRVAAALKSVEYPGTMAFVYRDLYQAEAEELKRATGASAVFDLNKAGGIGFVEEVCDSIVFPGRMENAMHSHQQERYSILHELHLHPERQDEGVLTPRRHRGGAGGSAVGKGFMSALTRARSTSNNGEDEARTSQLCNKVIDLSMLADRMSRRGMEIDMIREDVNELDTGAPPMADFPLVPSPAASLPITPHPSPITTARPTAPEMTPNTPEKSEAVGPRQVRETGDLDLELTPISLADMSADNSQDKGSDVAVHVSPRTPDSTEKEK
jgi:Trk K+ transport system NAD-binding subunit